MGAAEAQVISHYGYGCCSSCFALLTYEKEEEREREREREAKGSTERRGGAVPGSMQTAAV